MDAVAHSKLAAFEREYEHLKARARHYVEDAEAREKTSRKGDTRYKLCLIVGTGILTIINIIAPNLPPMGSIRWNVVAACLAVVINVIASIDAYRGHGRLARDHGNIKRRMRQVLYRQELEWNLRVVAICDEVEKEVNALSIIQSFSNDILQIIASFDPYNANKKTPSDSETSDNTPNVAA
ncbi:hypothetical protein [Sphingomonas azotifigens]|uniref:hypothetical protein n=1 Tax=Sphingomonas azotifigens TaxID=330920 RepID=UPI00111C49FE|nr:hypothetical protein [Sphingomonas azotifigens]